MASCNRYTGLPSSIVAIAGKKARELCYHKCFTPADFEDLQQELIIAVWKGLQAYELGEDGESIPIINREAFAQDIVNKKANDLIDKAEAEKRGRDVSICSLHDPISDDDEGYLLIDTISESSTFYEYNAMRFTPQIEFDIDMKLIIEKLPTDLQELYQLLQIMNITEIAKVKRKSRTTIHKKLERLQKELSEIFKAYNLKK